MEKYHFTRKENINDILENGLKPSTGNNSNVISDKRKTIYYSEGILGLLCMYFMMKNKYNELCENEAYLYLPLDFYKKKMEKYKDDEELYEHYKYEVEKLQNALNESVRAKSFSSPEEYYGMDYLLMFDKELGEPSDKDIRYEIYNKWTNKSIDKDSIKIAYISNGSNKVFDYKSIIDYCVSITDLDKMKSLLDVDECDKEINISVRGIISVKGLTDIVEEYYKKNQSRLKEEYSGYNIYYMSLSDYILENKSLM